MCKGWLAYDDAAPVASLRNEKRVASSSADHEVSPVPSPAGQSHLRVDARAEEVDVLLDALGLHPPLIRRRQGLEHHGESQLAVRLNSLKR